jgi:hypothetical protein
MDSSDGFRLDVSGVVTIGLRLDDFEDGVNRIVVDALGSQVLRRAHVRR